MIVGIHALSDEAPRLHEYSPVFDTERFTAHERFFVNDVPMGVLAIRRRAARRANRSVRILRRWRARIALGLRHPHVHGAILSGSPGAGYEPPDVMAAAIPRVYLFAGTAEPFFLDNATHWAIALHKAGADVVMRERAVPHGAARWRAELPLMVAWAFAQQHTRGAQSGTSSPL